MKTFSAAILLALICCFSHLQAQNDVSANSVAYHSTVSGIGFQTELGFLITAEKLDEERGLSIRQTASKNLGGLIGLGVGLGYDQYDTQNILPAFIQLKADLIPNKKYSPFLSGQGGYGVSISADETNEFLNESFEFGGGTYFQLGGGLMIRTKDNLSWIISLSYVNQSSSRIRTFTEPVTNGRLTIEESFTNNRVAVRVGFIF